MLSHFLSCSWRSNVEDVLLPLDIVTAQDAMELPGVSPAAKSGAGGYRSRYLAHAKRALYHLSYGPDVLSSSWNDVIRPHSSAWIMLQSSASGSEAPRAMTQHNEGTQHMLRRNLETPGFEPGTLRMRSGCDTTTPHPHESIRVARNG